MGTFSDNIFLIFLAIVAFRAAIYAAQRQCPQNENFLTCGSACPPTCANPAGPGACTQQCVQGCFCRPGYLRNDNGTCVNSTQCITAMDRSDPPSVCAPNEDFMSCGTACPVTCTQPEPVTCGLACSMGCFCKAGFYRDEASGKCVTLDKCPDEPCLNQNEVYDLCNKSCEPSCDDPEPICTMECAGGCVCSPGLLRNLEGDCVSVDKCPGNATEHGLLKKYLNTINDILQLTATKT